MCCAGGAEGDVPGSHRHADCKRSGQEPHTAELLTEQERLSQLLKPTVISIKVHQSPSFCNARINLELAGVITMSVGVLDLMDG